MSLSEIKNTIKNFGIRDDNEALAIKGDYGVGKTFYWQKLIKDSGIEKPYYSGFTSGEGKDRTIGKQQYIYVSLFGIENLSALKNLLFSEMVWSKNNDNFSNRSGIISKRIFGKLEKIPHIQKFTGDIISSLTFQEVKNALICFDDIDRKGSSLTVTEIIGLANLLKEQQNCKVVLILNEDGFEKSEEKNEFRKQVEKLIDFEIHFAPTPEEIIEYVFPNTFPNQEIIKNFCFKLKINNIRTLQKIKRYIIELPDYTNSVEAEVLKDVLKSLMLFVLSHYDRTNNIPTLEEIENFDFIGFQVNETLKKEISTRDIEINKFFVECDFRGVTDLDKEILKFVKSGFIDSSLFSEKLFTKNEAIIAQNGVNKYEQAWDLYSSSFKCNDTEFIKQLKEGFIANIDYLQIRNLTETIGILRKLNADQIANNLIDEYVDKRFDNDAILQMRRGHMDFNILDNYLRQRLEEKVENQTQNLTLKEVLERFSSYDPNYYEDIEFLMSVKEDDFYNYFSDYKTIQAENVNQFRIYGLSSQVKSCLKFINYEDDHKSIGEKTKRAIIRLALDCKINKIRIMNWFSIDEEEIEQQKNEDK